MNQLETLLNSLIKMGWKPFGEKNVKIEKTRNGFRFRSPLIWWFSSYSNRSLREIVSIKSGLWQFICKKDLHNKGSNWVKNLVTKEYGVSHIDNRFTYYDYEYRLIESALVPEEELIEFLVENINIEG